MSQPAELSREENVYMAKLAEQAERYEEMVEFMEKVAKTVDSEELTVEERNLLSVAYKNVIGARRASWRIISSIEKKEKEQSCGSESSGSESSGSEDRVTLIKDYRGKTETELTKICDGILKLLDSHLVPSSTAPESKVFYLKMKGDYCRYLAEFKTGAEKKDADKNTMVAYKAAQDFALAELPPTHPIRLGLALNLLVLDSNGGDGLSYYNIINSPDHAKHACNVAKAFGEASFNAHSSSGESTFNVYSSSGESTFNAHSSSGESTFNAHSSSEESTFNTLSDISEDAAEEIKEAPKGESGDGQ